MRAQRTQKVNWNKTVRKGLEKNNKKARARYALLPRRRRRFISLFPLLTNFEIVVHLDFKAIAVPCADVRERFRPNEERSKKKKEKKLFLLSIILGEEIMRREKSLRNANDNNMPLRAA